MITVQTTDMTDTYMYFPTPQCDQNKLFEDNHQF